MDIRQNPLWLSLSAGRWFQTDVRISIWFLLIPLSICARLGMGLGLLVTVLLFFSILLHEFAHIFAARRTGGSGDEILMWPLGGLAFASPAPNFFSESWTILAGPLTHVAICLACLPQVLGAGMLDQCVSLALPAVSMQTSPGESLVLLLFSINFKLLLINLLPIYPLDGGQFAFAVAKLSWDRQTARIGVLWAGILVCCLLSLVGLMIDSTEVLFLSVLLSFFCIYEYASAQVSHHFDESFMGYDFSQGYTSLESPEQAGQAPRLGPLARWKQEREAKRREQQEQQRIETDQRVDELLEKVHLHGMDSLTDAERRFLTRASNRYKSKG